MVSALGHSSLVVIMALMLLPSMPTLPIYAASPQSVQYSHLRKKERKGGERTEKMGKFSNKQFKSKLWQIFNIRNPATSKQMIISNIGQHEIRGKKTFLGY